MDLFSFDPATTFSFFLTFFRISLVVFLLPFFGGEVVPVPVKAALCIVLAVGLWPHLSFKGTLLPGHPLSIVLMIFGELVLGLTLSLLVQFVFAAVQTGGQIIGFQMGYAMINVIDPLTGVSEVVTAHFLYMTTLLTFLSLNGHLYLLRGLTESFAYIPPGALILTPAVTKGIINFSSQMFILAIKIASPVIVSVFLVDLALALISRAAPQMNVLLVGFPLKIMVGFLFLGFVFTLMSVYIEQFIGEIGPLFSMVLKAGR